MKKKLQKLIQKLDTLPQAFVITLGLILVIIITIIDYLITIDLGVSIFYLFPIFLVTWYGNRKVGFMFCLLCSLAWLSAETNISKNPNLWLEEWNAGVRFLFFITLTYLLSELKEAYEREKRLARIDGLTGAVNRRFFREVLKEEIERCSRYNHPFTLVYFDVDNFKIVNDKFGHSKGDYLLQLITETIKLNIRQTDTLARLGGDEFALLLLESEHEGIQIVLDRIQKELFIMVESEKLPISFSIGAITYYNAPQSLDHAIEEVDILMYDVKNNGKNRLNYHIK
jgi:diguanylate cyclase (GGDEF)-like protein